MAIPKDKTRIILTLKDYTKSCLEYLNEKDKRTASKEIEYIIEEYIDNLTSKNKEIKEELDNYYKDIYKPKLIANTIFLKYKNAYLIKPDEHKQKSFIKLIRDFEFREEFYVFNGETNKILYYIKQLFSKYDISYVFYKNLLDTLKIYLEINED